MQLETLQNCDLCGSGTRLVPVVSELPSEINGLQQLGVTGEYLTVVCDHCGWIFKPVVLSDSQLDDLYGRLGGAASLDVDAAAANRERSESTYRYAIGDEAPQTPLRVLDVGGGLGQVSLAFAEKGHDVHIVDVSAGTPLSEAMTVHRTSIAEFDSERAFDVAILSHILEHVWSPTDLLRKAWQSLADDGRVYVEVPFELYTPLLKKKLGDPCHVGYFTQASLANFLRKTGFQIERLERSLARYNQRQIMVLRAVARKQQAGAGTEVPLAIPRSGRRAAYWEMFRPGQLALTARFILGRAG